MSEPQDVEDWDVACKRAANGDVAAQTYVGQALCESDDPAQIAQGRRLLELAVKAGDADAFSHLGLSLVMHPADAQDFVRARALFEQGAQLGSHWCLYNLGVMHQQGAGVPADMKKALEFWVRAAKAGNGGAAYNLSVAHAKGISVAVDLQAALGWAEAAERAGDERGAPYARAIRRELGLPEAVSVNLRSDELASLMRSMAEERVRENLAPAAGASGEQAAPSPAPPPASAPPSPASAPDPDSGPAPTPQDEETLRRAAIGPDVDARYRLGVLLLLRNYVPPDPREALSWLESAARANHAAAAATLFKVLSTGQAGVARNAARADAFLAQAARAGHVEARFLYVRRYADGRIAANAFPDADRLFAECRKMYPDYHAPGAVARSPAELHAAARGGDLEATYLLAMALYLGEGVPRSDEKSLQCLRLGAKHNHAPSLAELARRHARGDGVPADVAAGQPFALAAARLGHFEALCELPMFGVSPSVVAALVGEAQHAAHPQGAAG